jgi:hypothetical protein
MIEAMKQALEALDDSVRTTAYNNDREYHYHTCCGSMLGNSHMSDCKQSNALTALREAIKQAEKQEPVACVIDGDLYFHHEIDWEDSAYQDDSVELLYAAPPKREWINLTDEEIESIIADHIGLVRTVSFAIEAGLKEKNR